MKVTTAQKRVLQAIVNGRPITESRAGTFAYHDDEGKEVAVRKSVLHGLIDRGFVNGTYEDMRWTITNTGRQAIGAETYWTYAEAADVLGVSHWTLRQHRQVGKITGTDVGGYVAVFTGTELEAYQKGRAIPPEELPTLYAVSDLAEKLGVHPTTLHNNRLPMLPQVQGIKMGGKDVLMFLEGDLKIIRAYQPNPGRPVGDDAEADIHPRGGYWYVKGTMSTSGDEVRHKQKNRALYMARRRLPLIGREGDRVWASIDGRYQQITLARDTTRIDKMTQYREGEEVQNILTRYLHPRFNPAESQS